MEAKKAVTHTATENIVCPWCGYKWLPTADTQAEWEIWGCYMPDPCRQCGKHYEIELHVARTYSTKKVEEG